MSRPQVLLLAFHFPPARGSGVFRIRAWANALVAAGADVTVLAVDRSFHEDLTGTDEATVAEVDPRVRIVRFRYPHQYLVSDFRRMSWLRGNLPEPHARFWRNASELAFPERYGHALPIMVAAALRLHARRRFDAVVASGNPYAQLGAAQRLGGLLRRPFVVDYHDAWTMDQFTGADRFPEGHRAWKWERRIIARAARTVTVNEPLADWYRGRYPEAAERIAVMENGFDGEVLQTALRPPPTGPVTVGYVGTLRPDLPMAAVLQGWRLFRASPDGAGSSLVLHGHLGFWRGTGELRGSALDGYEADGVSYRGPVPHPELPTAYAGFDALLLPLPTSRYVTSAKAYDYLGSGLPVLGAYGPENDTARVFAGSPLYRGVTAVEPTAIAAGFAELAAIARTRTDDAVAGARRLAAAHLWPATVAPQAEWLVARIGGRR